VYDLGGGTFDVSILSIEDGVFQVLATAGDTHLGGDDFDRALMDLARKELRGQMSQEELADPGLLQALRLAAERCKMQLSDYPEGELHLVVPDSGVHWHHEVSRERFEKLVEPLVERTLDEPCLARLRPFEDLSMRTPIADHRRALGEAGAPLTEESFATGTARRGVMST